jgi:hypothetical protein
VKLPLNMSWRAYWAAQAADAARSAACAEENAAKAAFLHRYVDEFAFRLNDAIADVVLRYRPKPQSKPAKKRQRRKRKLERE